MAVMREVELDDAPPAPSTRTPRDRHRPTRALVVAGLVAALALGGGQLVVGARDRAAVTRLAGVVDPLATPPQVRWQATGRDSVMWRGALDDGAFAELQIADDGSQQLSATDARTGARLWTSTLAAPASTLTVDSSTGDLVGDSTCAAPTPRRAPKPLVCLVADGYTRTSPQLGIASASEATTVPATSTTIEVVDPADGSVTAQWPVSGSAVLMPERDLVVVAGSDADSLDVVAYAIPTGQQRWRVQVPLVVPSPGGLAGRTASLVRAGSDIGAESFGTRTLLDTQGRVLRGDLGTESTNVSFVPRAGLLQLQNGADYRATTTVVSKRSASDVTVAGMPVRVGVDDGSLSDVVFTTGLGLQAWDARTGAPRWHADDIHPSYAAAIVLDGTLYLPTYAGVVALDGLSGHQRWARGTTSPDLMTTDGRRVIVAWSQSHTLGAYALSGGHEEWQVAYPPAVSAIEQVGRRLYGRRTDRSLVALVSP